MRIEIVHIGYPQPKVRVGWYVLYYDGDADGDPIRVLGPFVKIAEARAQAEWYRPDRSGSVRPRSERCERRRGAGIRADRG